MIDPKLKVSTPEQWADYYRSRAIEIASRLAEREKEIIELKRLYNSEQVDKDRWELFNFRRDERKAERYREALEKIQANYTGLAHDIAKAALGEKRHLERRDEGEGA